MGCNALHRDMVFEGKMDQRFLKGKWIKSFIYVHSYLEM